MHVKLAGLSNDDNESLLAIEKHIQWPNVPPPRNIALQISCDYKCLHDIVVL